jgi:hypothetical protein
MLQKRFQQIKTQGKHKAFGECKLYWIKKGIVLGLFQVWFLWITLDCVWIVLFYP